MFTILLWIIALPIIIQLVIGAIWLVLALIYGILNLLFGGEK